MVQVPWIQLPAVNPGAETDDPHLMCSEVDSSLTLLHNAHLIRFTSSDPTGILPSQIITKRWVSTLRMSTV